MKAATPIGELPILEDYKPIIQAARSKKLVLFIGAGVSRIIGCPSWGDLAREYLLFVKRYDLITFSELKHLEKQDARKLLSICVELLKNDPKKHIFPLRKTLNFRITAENRKYKDIYKLVVSFNCPCITTNIDELLDLEAVAVVKNLTSGAKTTPEIKQPNIYHHFSSLHDPRLLNSNDVVHIHGSINDKNKARSPVLTIEEYFQAYSRAKTKSTTDLPEFLSKLFSEKVVLFIGYGLEEYEVLEFLAQSIKNKSGAPHYMLSPFFEEESNLVRLHKLYYEKLGINLVPYSISRLGYGQLFFILDEWSKIIRSYTQSRTHLDNLSAIDSII